MNQNHTTINLSDKNYTKFIPPKRFDIIRILGSQIYSGDGWHIVIDASPDTEELTSPTEMCLSVKKINISRWWLIKKIQLWVLKYTFKN